MTMPEPIQTDRLILRRMPEQDLEDFVEYSLHPDHTRWGSGPPKTVDQLHQVLLDQIAMQPESGAWFKLAVELVESSKMIGDVCIKVLNPIHRQGEIGWFFNPAYQRKGYATEAARALLDFGFVTLGLHRLSARCITTNTRSYQLMERLGMMREGLFKESALIQGKWMNEYWYGLLKHEWLSRSTGTGKSTISNS